MFFPCCVFRILSIKFLGRRGVAARCTQQCGLTYLFNVYKNTIKRNIKNAAVYMGMKMIRQNGNLLLPMKYINYKVYFVLQIKYDIIRP